MAPTSTSACLLSKQITTIYLKCFISIISYCSHTICKRRGKDEITSQLGKGRSAHKEALTLTGSLRAGRVFSSDKIVFAREMSCYLSQYSDFIYCAYIFWVT
eukprot:g55087.t1